VEQLCSARPLDWGRLSAADRFAVAAADEACRQAGWPIDAGGTGLFFGSSTAGMAECETHVRGLLDPAAERPRLRQLISQQINGPGDAVARHRGVTGPVQTVSSACASGALAIAEALERLRSGELEVALAGGADALCHLTYGGFNSLRSVDDRPCRPFGPDRAGLSIGEGASVLVLERLEHATARGVRPLAELLGAGATCDAFHMTAPHPEGHGAAEAIRQALADAGLVGPDQQPGTSASIQMINAHGTGTPLNDLAEARAIAAVFGPAAASIPHTATKAALGHLLGCSGAIEAVATVLCLLDHEVYPTPTAAREPMDEATDRAAVEPPEPLEVDLVTGGPRPLPAGAIAISTSFAFGGANAALVLADLSGSAAGDTA
jgi:3-oxoacyl-[acyl-carrier-protein] synthase II